MAIKRRRRPPTPLRTLVGSAGEGIRGSWQPRRSWRANVASQTDDATLSDFGLDRDTVHRWRKRLKDPRAFDTTLEAAQERCRPFIRHFPGSAGSMARMLLLGAQGNAQKAPRRPRMGRRRAPSAWRTHPALVSWEFVGSRAHFACGIAGHVGVLAHAGSGGGRGRRSSIRRRMPANSARGTATSASWNTT